MSGSEVKNVNPFIRFRQHLDLYGIARDRGLDDADYIGLVSAADDSVAAVDSSGRGFRVSPLIDLDLGNDGRTWAKVETGSVGGSHKARHLFGLLLALLIEERTAPSSATRGDLAIASCGNAALGAAVVARGAGRQLRVFVPTTADPVVLDELERLQADITICQRAPGAVGDPCIVALDEAIAAGARPFTVQGTRAPLAIDGARTLGLELAEQLDERGVVPASIFVQIGGGALATAVLEGLQRAWPERRLPRFHPVQAAAAHPYVACWRRIVRAMLTEIGVADPGTDEARAEAVGTSFPSDRITAFVESHSTLMQPWPGTPASVASGILDDVTYDWMSVIRPQLLSGGWPVLVAEETFVEAAAIAAGVEPPPDETGAAGLAGLLTLRRSGTSLKEPSVVLLTGCRR